MKASGFLDSLPVLIEITQDSLEAFDGDSSFKAVVERAMQGEMSAHLGYPRHDAAGTHTGNSRNGVSRKTLKGDFGEVEIETPRDRKGEFEPQMVRKHQTRWTGFDDKILSMY